MANYFKSEDVKIFPCAYRGQGIDIEASSFTEYNFTNIYSKQGLKKESFIISYTANELKCIIGGYYFEINLTNYTDKSKYKYLAIKISNKELIPFEGDQPEPLDDDNGNFLGLAGDETELNNATAILQIFDSHIEIDDEEIEHTVYTLCESSKRLEDIISAGSEIGALRSYYIDNNQNNLNTASGKYAIAIGEKVYAENNYTMVFGNALKSKADNQIILGTGTITDATNITQADADATIQIFKDGESIYKLNNTGNETILGNIKTAGIEETTKVVITKPVELNSTLDISGKITANDELEVAKKASFENVVEIDGATTVNNTLTVTKSDAETIINENGIITNKAIEAAGDLTTSTNLSVGGITNITGQTTTSNIILNGSNVDYITAGDNKLDKNGNLAITGNISSKKLKVETADDTTNITLDGNASVSGNLIVNGKLKSKYIEEDFVQGTGVETTTTALKLTANKIDATGTEVTITNLNLANNVGLSVANKQYNNQVPSTQTDGKKVNNTNAVCFNTGIDTIGPITAYYTGNNKEYAFAAFEPNKDLTAGLKFDGTAYFKQKLIVGGDNINLDIPDATKVDSIISLLPNDCIFYTGTFGAAIKDKLAVGNDAYFDGNIDINSNKTITFGNQIKINLNGEGSIIATSFGTSSDIRLKQNIKPYYAPKSILDLDVKEFEYIDDGLHTKHIGCIAQDLQEICPEIVHENVNGYLTIEENKLVYLLLNEVKELKKEIKSLKGE